MSQPSQPLDMQKKFSQVYNFPIEDVDEDEDVDVDEDVDGDEDEDEDED